MPLGHTPCRPLPELELLKRRSITAKVAAEKLRAYIDEQAQTGATELATTGAAQVSYNQLRDILARLENDWADHSEEHLLDCFVEVDAHVEVHLHPCYMGAKLKQGLRKVGGEILLKYWRTLGCIPLTLADLQPSGSRHGAIVGDTPYIHFLASFKSVGFAPQKAHWLLGRIATEQPYFKGMNVNILSLVNIMVQQDSIPRELSYSRPQRAWLNGETQLSDKHLVLLKVVRIDTEACRQGDMGIELTGLIETVGHIRAKRRAPKSALDVASPGPVVLETPRKKTSADTPPTKRKREPEVDGGAAPANGDAVGTEDAKKEKKEKKEKKAKEKVLYA